MRALSIIGEMFALAGLIATVWGVVTFVAIATGAHP